MMRALLLVVELCVAVCVVPAEQCETLKKHTLQFVPTAALFHGMSVLGSIIFSAIFFYRCGEGTTVET